MQKIFKKVIALLTITIMSISMFTGCSKKEIGPEVVTKAMFDLFILDDTTAGESVGITVEQGEELVAAKKDAGIQALQTLFSALGGEVSDEKIEEIYNAQAEALRKTSFETEEISSEKDKKVIKISTTYIDTYALQEKASESLVAKIESGEITDISNMGEVLADILIEEMQNASVSEDKKSFEAEFELTKVDVNGKDANMWLPADTTTFGAQLSSLVSGIN